MRLRLGRIDPVTRADLYAAFRHTAADTLHIGQISRLQTCKNRPHPGCGTGVEPAEPATERTAAPVIDVFPDLRDMVTLPLPSCSGWMFGMLHPPLFRHKVKLSSVLPPL